MPPILPDNAPKGQADAPVSLGNITLGIYESAKRSSSIWQRRPLDIIVADFVRGDNLAGVTEAYRNRLAAEGKDAARALKAGGFPAVTLSGVIDAPRKGNAWPIRHTGLYQVDIDGLPPDAAAELRERAAALDCIALAYISPSMGLKVWARGAPAADKADHRRQWTAANQAVCAGLGLDFDAKDADAAVKSPIGLCFLCHDAGAYYNASAIPLPPAPAGRPPRRRAAQLPPATDGALAGQLAYIQQALPPPGANTYPDFLAVCAALKELGWTESAVAAWAEGTARGRAEYTWTELPAESGEAGDIIRRVAWKLGWRGGIQQGPAAALNAGPDFPFWHADEDELLDYGAWETSVSADARRFMRLNAPNILLALPRGPEHRKVYLDLGYGVWTDNPDKLHQAIYQSRQIWAHTALDHAPAKYLGPVARYARSANTPAQSQVILQSCGAHYLGWDSKVKDGAAVTLNPIPPEQHCLLMDIDAQTRYLGAPNGVIDLHTGELLTGPAARATLTSRQLPDAYNPNATSPAVDRLFGHIPATEREWLFSALGHALRGYPNRRLYLITGPAGAGKSTMLQAIAGALGDCGGELSLAALREKRDASANQPEAMGLQQWRVAVITEPPGGGAISESRIRAASGGDAIPLRLNYSNELHARRTTATMFWACNPDNIPALALQQKALFDRLRVLQYPALPDGARDESLPDSLAQPAARQALVALLVKAAVANPKAPADIPSVAAARATLRDETVGEAGQYLLAAVIPEAGRRLGTAELWDAACAYAGVDGAAEVWGYGRREFTQLARSLLELPFTRTVRIRGAGPQKGWLGYRLATAIELEQRLAAQDDTPALPAWCMVCGRDFPPGALAQVESLPVNDAGVAAGFCPDCWPPDALRQRLYRLLAGQCLLWLFANGQEARWDFDAAVPVAQAIYGMRIAALDSVYTTLKDGAGDWQAAMQAAMQAAIDAAPDLPRCIACGEGATPAQLDQRGECGICRRGLGTAAPTVRLDDDDTLHIGGE